jgi:tetratricopeptide (TPR) repeat protein
MALLLLGRARRDQGDYTAALKAFNEQLDLANKTGDRAHLAVAREGVASVLGCQQRYPEALAAYRLAHVENQERGDQPGAAYALANSALMLAQLGRYREARETLAQVAASGGYAELARIVEQYQAEIALSERRFALARNEARRLLASSGEIGAAQLIDIHLIDCGAGLHSALRQALSACDSALALARKSGLPRLEAAALLFWAEARLENGNPSAAKEAALSARAEFARGGQRESEARASLVAARAAQALRDASGARSLAAQAAGSFEALLRLWTPEDRAAYESRPDVRHWRSQLAGISTR